MQKILASFLIGLSICSPALLHARPANLEAQIARAYLEQEQEAVGKPQSKKSYGAALAWGWSPIPGDGLFYTEHPIQGGITLALGLAGAGLAVLAVTERCDETNHWCFLSPKQIAGGFGIATYLATYLWDGIGSTIAGRKYRHRNAEPTEPLSEADERDTILLK